MADPPSHRRRRRRRRSRPLLTPARLAAVVGLTALVSGLILADWWQHRVAEEYGTEPAALTATQPSPPAELVNTVLSHIQLTDHTPGPTPSRPAAATPLATPTPTPRVLPPVRPPPATGGATRPRPPAYSGPASERVEAAVDLARSVPADALVFLQINPFAPGTAAHSARLGDMIRMVLPLAQMAPPDVKAFVDLLAPLPTLTTRQNGFALLNAQAKRFEGNVVRISLLEMALIVRTDGDNREVLERLQNLVSSYVKPEDARIENITRDGAPQYASQQLTHRKLPDWAVLEWGQMDESYVICLGRGVFDRLLATRLTTGTSLAEEPWYAASQARLQGDSSFLSLYGNLERVREQLEQVLDGKPRQIMKELQVSATRRARWTMGLVGRFMRSELLLGEPHGDFLHTLSDPRPPPAAIAAAIPPGASVVSVSAFDLPLQLKKIGEGWMAAMTPQMQQELREVWGRLGDQVGGDMTTALVDRMGPHVVIHNYPPHELGWSLMFTILLEYDGTASVYASMDAVMQQLQRELEAMANAKSMFNLRLVRDADGIWSLPLVVFTPAIGVSERFIVISWSPKAVKVNLDYLKQHAPAQPAQP